MFKNISVMVNPCFCGCSLKTATLVLAVIDMVISAFTALVMLVFGGVAINNAPSGGEVEKDAAQGEAQMAGIELREREEFLFGTPVPISVAVFGGSLLLCAVRFYFAVVLKRGSDEEDATKCKIWIMSACFFGIVLGIGFTVLNYLLGKDALENVGNFIGIAYAIFGIWVVYEFIKEIRSGKIQRTHSMV